MRIAFITRSTIYSVPGGDTVQIEQTAKGLRSLGESVNIIKAGEKFSEKDYDLFHYFNITRPADFLTYVSSLKKPYFISPLLVDYSEYDKFYRKGLSGWLLRRFSPDGNEFMKTIGRWILGKDRLASKRYLWKGQKKSMQLLLEKATAVLPNSLSEQNALEKKFNLNKPFAVIPNGIDPELFKYDAATTKDLRSIICAARIEGIKNQENLIKAVNGTDLSLQIAGAAAPNQKKYFSHCQLIAGTNVHFVGRLSQSELIDLYKRSKVHVLPSWFETCGLSTLEAAAMGCNIVITDKGYTRDYFGDDAYYCDPADPSSILQAIRKASANPVNEVLVKKIREQFTWKIAAEKTLAAYQKFSGL